jgi:Collagen triple helix repeat (20 copies)
MRRKMIACALLLCAACQGERGPAGEDGEDGEDGMDGQAGPQGPMGEQGLMGLQGAMGAIGETGPAGPSGPKGDTGPRGPTGAPGSAGSQGASAQGVGGSGYRPASFVGCAATLDLVDGDTLGEDGIGETIVQYILTTYSNGDVEVRCFAVLGTHESPQYSAYFPSITTGAETASCDVTSDYPPYPMNGGVPGYWHLQLTNRMPSATYVDSDLNHPLDGQGFMFAEDDCAAFVMDLGGMWYASTLAEAL